MVRDDSLKSAKKRQRLSPRRLALSLGFIIIITVVGTLLVRIISNKGEASPTNQVKSVLSGDELRDYNSPDNNFAIKFPGFPTVDKTSNKSAGKEIPITTYQRLLNNNAINYTVAVYDYKAINLTGNEDKALESALNSSLQKKPNIAIISTEKKMYGQYKAIEATYNQTEKDKTYEAHIRYIIKDSKIYSIILIGADKTKFDEFANSLKLN